MPWLLQWQRRYVVTATSNSRRLLDVGIMTLYQRWDWHSNWSLLILSPLWLEYPNEVLTGTIVELVEPETLS